MVKILEISIFDKRPDDAVDLVIAGCMKSKNNLCISATSAHGLVTARENRNFADVLKKFYLNLPDGMPLVWVGKLKGKRRMRRCYGPDFFKNVIKASAKKNIKHYFCGGKGSVAEKLKKACKTKFKNNNVVGCFSPPFREMSDIELKKLGRAINHSKASIAWIGISTPKQEIFALRLSKFTKVNFIITVGAAFDFHTGGLKQAPKFMQRLGLEWLFRLYKEPKRLTKRYLKVVPFFLFYNLKDFLKL